MVFDNDIYFVLNLVYIRLNFMTKWELCTTDIFDMIRFLASYEVRNTLSETVIYDKCI